MPIYEFECRRCDARFEVYFRSRDEKRGVTCEKCGSGRVEKVFSVFGSRSGGGATGREAAPPPGGGGGGCCGGGSCGCG